MDCASIPCLCCLFWIGGRARKGSWIFFGILYLVASLVISMFLAEFRYTNITLYFVVAIVCFLGYLTAIVHALLVRKKYLIRREAILDLAKITNSKYSGEIRRKYVGGTVGPAQAHAPTTLSQTPLSAAQAQNHMPTAPTQTHAPTAPTQTHAPTAPAQAYMPPAPAQAYVTTASTAPAQAYAPITPGQPFPPPLNVAPADSAYYATQDALAQASSQSSLQRIDLNSCSEQELANLPGVGVVLAKRAIELRGQTGGFISTQDFSQRLGLMPHFAVQVDGLAYVASYVPAQLPPQASGRIVDV